MKLALKYKINFLTLVVIALQMSCRTQHTESSYPNYVGDIIYDEKRDGDHVVCNTKNTFQYHNFSKGPLYPKSKKIFQDDCKKLKFDEKVNGTVRVRFIVNCKGEAGRFRVISGRLDDKNFNVDDTTALQLIDVINSQGNWPIMKDNDIARDYYAYFLFVFEKGHIRTILP